MAASVHYYAEHDKKSGNFKEEGSEFLLSVYSARDDEKRFSYLTVTAGLNYEEAIALKFALDAALQEAERTRADQTGEASQRANLSGESDTTGVF